MPSTSAGLSNGYLYYRHRLPVRIMHWVNVIAITILFMSGLAIFNAHPALNWGKSSYTGRPPLLEITAEENEAGQLRGVTRVLGREFDTTGVLGASKAPNGNPNAVGFPWWITIPDLLWLSMARSWHFFFAWIFVINGLIYILYTIASRHLSMDFAPTPTDWRSIGRSIRDHLLFRHPRGRAAMSYNVLQKLAYLTVIFVLLPLVVIAGLAMSPWLDTVLPGWIDLLGGRQSARTIHFIVAWILVVFAAIHIFEVIVTGLWNNLRSMVTGRYRIRAEASHRGGKP